FRFLQELLRTAVPAMRRGVSGVPSRYSPFQFGSHDYVDPHTRTALVQPPEVQLQMRCTGVPESARGHASPIFLTGGHIVHPISRNFRSPPDGQPAVTNL